MDVYLPADFYHLRDAMPDWRDVPETDAGREKNHVESVRAVAADALNTCVDPLWKVF